MNSGRYNEGGVYMKVYLNEITGIDDAITSMYMSRRSWNRDLEDHIRFVCNSALNRNGSLKKRDSSNAIEYDEFTNYLDTLVKWGWQHTTMLRFIDMSITVEGLHRAGQDDWDAHAKRFNNRIIRCSTRTKQSDFFYELSTWYEGKIIPTDVALNHISYTPPKTINIDGKEYIKAVNGYILKGLENNPDVKRGLYMLSIPSNFIFKIDLCEWAHVYKMRNITTNANPEVQECCELISDQLQSFHRQFSRDLFAKVLN